MRMKKKEKKRREYLDTQRDTRGGRHSRTNKWRNSKKAAICRPRRETS